MITHHGVILCVGCSQRSLRCAWCRKPQRWKKRPLCWSPGTHDGGHAAGCTRHEQVRVVSLCVGSSWERAGRTCVLDLAWQILSFSTDVHWTALGCRLLELFSLGRYQLSQICAQDCSPSPHGTRCLCLKKTTKRTWYSFLLGLFGDLITVEFFCGVFTLLTSLFI